MFTDEMKRAFEYAYDRTNPENLVGDTFDYCSVLDAMEALFPNTGCNAFLLCIALAPKPYRDYQFDFILG